MMKHMDMDHSLDHGQPISSHFLEKNGSPSHNSYQFPIIPQLGVGPRGTLSYPCPYVDGLDLLKGFRR